MNNESSTVPSLGEVLQIANNVIAYRYLTVSGVVIILYDSIQTLQTELFVIWRTRLSVAKAAYIFYRYIMLVGLLLSLVAASSARQSPEDWCEKMTIAMCIMVFSGDAVGHCLVLFRTFTLWERKRFILVLLCLGSVVTNVVSVAFLVLLARDLIGAKFIEGINACSTDTKDILMFGVWTPQVVFDIYVLVLVMWNVMDKPRLPSQKVLKAAHEDGLTLIFIAWILRLLNAILCISETAVRPFVVVSFSESLITTINLRLLLRIFQSESNLLQAGRDSMELDVLVKRSSGMSASVGNS